MNNMAPIEAIELKCAWEEFFKFCFKDNDELRNEVLPLDHFALIW